MQGRRITTQAEADEMNELAERMRFRDQHGRPLRFSVATDESMWAEFCELWPRVSEWARVDLTA